MELETTRFGCIHVDETKCLYFFDGLPGFKGARSFTLLPHRPKDGSPSPFHWLQSIEEGALALPLINPWLTCADYAPTIPGLALMQLGITDIQRQGKLYCVVTIPNGAPQDSTVNLLAPILINRATRQCRQIILQQEGYGLRVPLRLGEQWAERSVKVKPAA